MFFIWVYEFVVVVILGGRSFGNSGFEGGQRFSDFN